MVWRRLGCLLLGALICGLAAGGEFVPFVIPAKPNPESLIAVKSIEPIGVRHGRLVARDSHFYNGGERVRLWGVNLSFNASFPSHEDAPYIAARMAQAGVNTVRCHHMDTSLWPRGIWDEKEPTKLKAEALDRLDYFIDQLARQGIWVNINLHVGRGHSRYIGLPRSNENYDKVSCLFTPALIEAQKKYARDLLGHVNKYRKIRYADDPAVAMVEITNENSFFMWDGEERLRTLPDYYAAILQKMYNDWLLKKYGSESKLRLEWGKDAEPLGKNFLRNGAFSLAGSGGRGALNWNVEQHEGCKASASIDSYKTKKALRFDIQKKDETDWHLQLTNAGFALEEGKYHTVSFEAAASGPREIRCSVSQAHDPWGNMGLSRTAELTADWKEFTMGFVARRDDEDCRISFTLGNNSTSVYFANVQLRPGGRIGLGKVELLKDRSVKLYGNNESSERTLDRMVFLAEAEKQYFDGMREFIKKDIGCKALVTGTIVFGPLGLYGQSDMDFVDSHSYWQHPRFPGRPWDQGNWLIDQKPMVDYPQQATLFRMAAERLNGKPFTVTEYNHPAPLDSQAECVPMIASFGATQDWDGIWFYTYSHSGDQWDRTNMSSFFDVDTNPGKWGFMRAGAAIFCDGIVPPLSVRTVALLGRSPGLVRQLAQLHLKHGSNMFTVASEVSGATRQTILGGPLSVSLAPSSDSAPMGESRTRLSWSVEEDKGVYMLGAGAGVLAGYASVMDQASEGFARFADPEFVVITATPLDGMPWWQSSRILLTACGRCENTGMKFSEDRRTVGRDWGRGPVQIEAVEGAVIVPEGDWKCQALNPDGTVRAEVPIRSEADRKFMDISPKYGTMWYLLTQQ